MNLAAIYAVLDALEAGDQALAVEILLSIIEDGVRSRPYACECGAAFSWRGEGEAHRLAGACPRWEATA